MALYEVSRRGSLGQDPVGSSRPNPLGAETTRFAQPVANPNSGKLTLSLGGLRRKEEVLVDGAGKQVVHRAGDDKVELADQTRSATQPPEVLSELPSKTCKKPARALLDQAPTVGGQDAHAGSLPGLRRPLPFVAIPGTVSDFPVSWTSTTDRAAALNRWCAIIATETMRSFPAGSSDRLGAKKFVWSHRLSIANAFERKIIRVDVVAELARMFAELTNAPVREAHEEAHEKANNEVRLYQLSPDLNLEPANIPTPEQSS